MNRSFRLLLLAGPVAALAQAAPGAPLTLADALRLADENNPGLRAARGEARAAAATAAGAAARLRPSVGFEAGAARTTDPVGVFGGKLRQGAFGPADFAVGALNRPDPLTDYSLGLRLEQPLYAGGGLRAGREAGERGARAAEEGAAEARARVRGAVVRAYYAVPLADAAAAATREALALARAHADLLRARVRQGLALEADLKRVEVFAAGLEGELARREADAELARAGLAALLGDPDAAWEPVDAFDPEAPLPDGLGRRDTASVRLRDDALEARRRGAAAGRFPAAMLTGAWNRDLGGGNGAAGRGYYTLGIGLRWSLYDGGRRAADYAEATARAEAGRAEGDELRARAAMDLRAARARLDSARRRAVVAAEAVESAREVRRVAAVREAAGSGPLSDTLDAEGQALRADLELKAARFDVWTARADLAYAQGAEDEHRP